MRNGARSGAIGIKEGLGKGDRWKWGEKGEHCRKSCGGDCECSMFKGRDETSLEGSDYVFLSPYCVSLSACPLLSFLIVLHV